MSQGAPAAPKALAVNEADVVDAFRAGVSKDGLSIQSDLESSPASTTNTTRETTLAELKISRRSTRKFSVPVYTKDATVSWTFRLQDYDVNFAVSFVPLTDSVAENEEEQVVREVTKVKSSKNPIKDSFTVPGPGEVILTVDNGYSYMRSKNLLELSIVVDNDTDTPYGTDPQAVDDDDGMHDMGRYELNMETQVHGLSVHPERWDAQLKWKITGVRERLSRKEPKLYEEHVAGGFLTDATIVRFLIARGMDIKVATKLLRETLPWWTLRNPGYVIADPNDDRAKQLELESRTGKIRVPGRDRHGRAVLVFDNESQNTANEEHQLDFLAYNMGLTTRTMAPGVDKMCLLIHLGRMSMSSSPSMRAIKETINILSKFFPETLGTAVLYQPPKYFIWLYHTIKSLVDKRTRKKIVFIHGDVSDGSKNDAKMRYLIGPDWKKITGAEQPTVEKLVYSEKYGKEIPQSVGYDHDVYWKNLIEREAEYIRKQQTAAAASSEGAPQAADGSSAE